MKNIHDNSFHCSDVYSLSNRSSRLWVVSYYPVCTSLNTNRSLKDWICNVFRISCFWSAEMHSWRLPRKFLNLLVYWARSSIWLRFGSRRLSISTSTSAKTSSLASSPSTSTKSCAYSSWRVSNWLLFVLSFFKYNRIFDSTYLIRNFFVTFTLFLNFIKFINWFHDEINIRLIEWLTLFWLWSVLIHFIFINLTFLFSWQFKLIILNIDIYLF